MTSKKIWILFFFSSSPFSRLKTWNFGFRSSQKQKKRRGSKGAGTVEPGTKFWIQVEATWDLPNSWYFTFFFSFYLFGWRDTLAYKKDTFDKKKVSERCDGVNKKVRIAAIAMHGSQWYPTNNDNNNIQYAKRLKTRSGGLKTSSVYNLVFYIHFDLI